MSLLSRLRERYTIPSTASLCASPRDDAGAGAATWPRAPCVHPSEALLSDNECERCRRLVVDLQLLQQEMAEDRRTIDLLTVTLAWERAHGCRRGASFGSRAVTTEHHHPSNNNVCLSSDKFGASHPSEMVAAYKFLLEARAKAEMDWLRQRHRYELEISELKERLTRAERQMKDGIKLLHPLYS